MWRRPPFVRYPASAASPQRDSASSVPQPLSRDEQLIGDRHDVDVIVRQRTVTPTWWCLYQSGLSNRSNPISCQPLCSVFRKNIVTSSHDLRALPADTSTLR
jgi:hypothetical protein